MSAVWEIREGGALERLAEMPDDSVHCVVTSPPYYGLRDYEAEGQIGLEPTLEAYVDSLVRIFAEVRRVLRPDGTAWLNLGDSYASKPRGSDNGWDKSRLNNPARVQKAQAASLRRGRRTRGEDAKEKDLLMVPPQVALALRADGWWLRKTVIWSKRSPMPENVHDRPASSHEYMYLLAKSKRYFYDTEAVRQPDCGHSSGNGFARPERLSYQNADGTSRQTDEEWTPGGGRHLRDVLAVDDDEWTAFLAWRQWCAENDQQRDVWTLSSQPFAAAHFATFPPKLVEPCILAGTSDHGVCVDCGAPWRRVVEVDGETSRDRVRERGQAARRQRPGVAEQSLNYLGKHREIVRRRRTVGWEAPCGHDGDPVPATVLDPFSGAGTTGLVALRLGRSYVGIEINPAYADLSRRRIVDDAPLINAAAEVAA